MLGFLSTISVGDPDMLRKFFVLSHVFSHLNCQGKKNNNEHKREGPRSKEPYVSRDNIQQSFIRAVSTKGRARVYEQKTPYQRMANSESTVRKQVSRKHKRRNERAGNTRTG